MKVYVAGSSAELERCQSFIACAREIGFDVTADWPAHVHAVVASGGAPNNGLADEQRREAKKLASDGVDACELFVLLLPGKTSDYIGGKYVERMIATIGAWWELSRAEMLGKEIVIVGEAADRTVMTVGMRVIAEDSHALAWMSGRIAAAQKAVA